MKVAIIPARGGSKRIPRKNIRTFAGLPMLAWSIRAAQASECFDRIVVSTDDAEIAEVARAQGAQVPFVRPAALSDDHAATVPVVAHAVAWLAEQGAPVAQACCIYATAPFIRPSDLRQGLQLLVEGNLDYAFAATSFAYPIQRALRITPEGRVEMMSPQFMNTRSQDLEPAWHDAGQFYWGQAQAWLEARPIFGPHSAPVVLPRHRVQDIDTVEDLERAEWMFRSLQSKEFQT